MNTTGMIRGYMSKNMKTEEFIKLVIAALSREFEKEVKLEIINENGFWISLDNYKIKMSKELIEKHKTPYGIDRFILEAFEKQGFKFNRNRSQYIQYCFGSFEGM
ncbi:hypothetical protein [Clostridium sp.]|uniref:hypothetical protein n=1 Tax=Clostridium sp. TaxID=1506 RepID=UPI001A4F1A3E|nr:hypothetical protein [Clostridium sp.]MBK5242621.1 hypothetical protein [Clostridium sp.]